MLISSMLHNSHVRWRVELPLRLRRGEYDEGGELVPLPPRRFTPDAWRGGGGGGWGPGGVGAVASSRSSKNPCLLILKERFTLFLLEGY